MQKLKTSGQNFEKVSEILTGRNKNSRKMANNSYLERKDNGSIAYRLHSTDIVTYYPDKIVLNSAGWLTTTTKDRMNQALRIVNPDLGISQKNKNWFFVNGHYIEGSGYQEISRIPFIDGLKVDYAGNSLVKSQVKNAEKTEKDRIEISKQISAYIKTLSKSIDKKSFNLDPKGDCWYCAMRTVDNHEPLGQAINDKEHLLEHLKEKYIMISLIINALESRHYGAGPGIWLCSYDETKDPKIFISYEKIQFNKSVILHDVRKYFQDSLLWKNIEK